MTPVKICGLTTPEDARLACELGAFAIGMVFWPGSPRAVTAEQAQRIGAAIPSGVLKVGVFVNQPPKEVGAVAREAALDVVQLHGSEDPAAYAGLARQTWKMVPVRDRDAIESARRVAPGTTVLLDAHDPARHGGTGQTVDWAIAADVARERPVVLSGGLRPDNVAVAIGTVAPYAIDVSSGVEASPGRKDPTKLRALFAALHAL